jgi:hypothetical protein
VHLTEAGGRERLVLERLEHVRDRHAELRLDHTPDGVAGVWRYLVLERPDCGQVRLGQDVCAGAE